jgi:hypothetical protein
MRYDCTEASCMGIYGNIQDAKKAIIKYVFDFEHYDPKKRFHYDTDDFSYSKNSQVNPYYSN